jgi:hypothetical protein
VTLRFKDSIKFALDEYMGYLDENLDEFMEIAKETIRTFFG